MARVTPDEIVAGEDADRFHQDAIARLPLATDIALSALKALMLINGGAIVALFTFIGNTQPERYDLVSLKAAFWWYIVGLGATTAANIGGYVCQSYYFQASVSQSWNAQARQHGTEEKWKAAANRETVIGSAAEWTALAAVTLALSAFGAGSWRALDGVLPASSEVSRPAAPRPISSPARTPSLPSSSQTPPSPASAAGPAPDRSPAAQQPPSRDARAR
jgi:hypothetical protein